ncbi:hypothetical protein E2C01_062369 [Portunus trituberculatus]|uniref:Uncharacterized protein n=1 Tax=Portunus trituberculatus TaxID=210409 RepID=A0A5B7HAX2_PORTR|nr:hypothetical protein [Portunus trituberculatus]
MRTVLAAPGSSPSEGIKLFVCSLELDINLGSSGRCLTFLWCISCGLIVYWEEEIDAVYLGKEKHQTHFASSRGMCGSSWNVRCGVVR